VVYLDGEDLLRLHKIVIDYAGGSHGIRDQHLLGSILEAPKQSFGGTELYPDVWEKAANYLEKLAKFHVFIDGNKRTALAATARFLALNRYHFNATNKDSESFVLSVIKTKMNVPDIAAWLKKYSRKGQPN